MPHSAICCWSAKALLGLLFSLASPIKCISQDFYAQPFAAVSVGEFHALAIDRSGNLWAWGCNIYGQLGNGLFCESSTPAIVMPGTRFASVHAGAWHSLAIDTQGNLWAWGRNNRGQLGDGSNNSQPYPIQIMPGTKFQSAAPGYDFSILLDANGSLWSTGANDFSQLGTDTPESQTLPVAIIAPNKFASVVIGTYHALAIDVLGALWSWGFNCSGQCDPNQADNKTTPSPIIPHLKFKAAAGGYNHSLAIDQAGKLWAWGGNDKGQLGVQTSSIHNNAPINPIPTKTFTRLSAASSSSTAIDSFGALWVWGDNYHGQLGTSSLHSQPIPLEIKYGIIATSIGSGSLFFIDDVGRLFNSGRNEFGVLSLAGSAPISPILVNTAYNPPPFLQPSISISAFGSNGGILVVATNSAPFIVYDTNGIPIASGLLRPGTTLIPIKQGLYTFKALEVCCKLVVR